MTEPRKTPLGKQIAGLAAMVERFAETYHACASNTADEWEAGRLLEAAKQLRELDAEAQELRGALEAIEKDLRDCGIVRDADNINKLLARHRAKQEVQT